MTGSRPTRRRAVRPPHTPPGGAGATAGLGVGMVTGVSMGARAGGRDPVRAAMRRFALQLGLAMAWPGVVVGHFAVFGRPSGAAERASEHAGRPGHVGPAGHLLDAGGPAVAALALAVALTVVVLALTIRQALRSDARLPVGATVLRATGVQMALFGGIEAAERGWSLAATVSDPWVVRGLAVQAAVALVVAGGLTLFAGAVRTVAPLRPPVRWHAHGIALPTGGRAQAAPRPVAILRHAAPRAPPAVAGR